MIGTIFKALLFMYEGRKFTFMPMQDISPLGYLRELYPEMLGYVCLECLHYSDISLSSAVLKFLGQCFSFCPTFVSRVCVFYICI